MKSVILNGSPRGRKSNTRILMESFRKGFGVIVQSGFPEAVHSSFITRYFRRLAEKREALFIGELIKGGVEGLQMMPEKMTRGVRTSFRELGKSFRGNGRLDGASADSLKSPWRMGPVRRLLFSLARIIGLSNFYWDHKLKANGAFGERFAAPYESDGLKYPRLFNEQQLHRRQRVFQAILT